MTIDMPASLPRKSSTGISQTVMKYGIQLLNFIRGKVEVLEDAEDIVQDVWYQYSRLSNLDEIENISAWLYKVARNKITDKYRRKKSESFEDYVYHNEDGELYLRDILLSDDREDAETAQFKKRFWIELQNALKELPPLQQLVFIENEIEGKTLRRIAAEQQENIKTIISRKAYAVKHLRKKLEPLYRELNF
jgi:RNA polymerase sigma factor (sigma-70 family)